MKRCEQEIWRRFGDTCMLYELFAWNLGEGEIAKPSLELYSFAKHTCDGFIVLQFA